jgi:hypothetical protein
MKGRRATLAFFAAVAVLATIAGLGLDRDGKRHVAAAQAAVPPEPEAIEETGAIPVVNADGSLRRPDQAPAMSEDASGLDDDALAVEQGGAMDEAPDSESEADWAAPDRHLPQEAAGRIE